MRDVLRVAQAWQREGVGFGRAVAVRVHGSAPFPAGAVLLVADDGRLAGSVSGGCVESAAAEEVAAARGSGVARLVTYGISDEVATGVGLACGGVLDVLIEPEVRPDVLRAASRPEASVVATPLPAAGSSEPDGAELAEATGVALGSERSAVVSLAGAEWFLEVFPARRRLVIFGATQVAITLARLAREVGYQVVVADARSAFATPDRFPDVDRLVLGWPDEVFEQVGLAADDAVVVLTHDPKLDEPAILEALKAGCRYVGAIGSRQTQASRRERLVAAGTTTEDLERLRAPIGLDLGGRAPAEIALAIVGEIVAVRNGASGRPMVEARGRSRDGGRAGSEPGSRPGGALVGERSA